jgi:hypothetical protein
MGLAESALILLGIGIVSSRFKAGVGLGELGTGISTLVAAPLVGTGTGLSTFSGGLRDLAETLGDLGRGFSALFESIPKIPGFGPGEGFGGNGGGARQNGNGQVWFMTQPDLTTDSGGSGNTLLTGGGGNVPNGRILTLEGVGAAKNGFTGTYSQALSFYQSRGLSLYQAQALVSPHYGIDKPLVVGNLV